jgi:hypothetical protein
MGIDVAGDAVIRFAEDCLPPSTWIAVRQIGANSDESAYKFRKSEETWALTPVSHGGRALSIGAMRLLPPVRSHACSVTALFLMNGAKTNLAAILAQHGIRNVRSL